MTTLLRSTAGALALMLVVAACGGSAPPQATASCGTTKECVDDLATALERLTPAQLEALGASIRKELAAVEVKPREVNGVEIGGADLKGDLERLAKTFPEGLAGATAAVDRVRTANVQPISIPIALL